MEELNIIMKFNEYKYERPNFKNVALELEDLAKKIDSSKNIDDIKKYINECNIIRSNFDTMATLVSIRHSINTLDEYYEKENDIFDENSNIVYSYLWKSLV